MASFKLMKYFLHSSLTNFIDKIISQFISACRKYCSPNHVLTRLIEKLKKALDNKNIVGAVRMYLSEMFDNIPYDLHVAEFHAYGLFKNGIRFINS